MSERQAGSFWPDFIRFIIISVLIVVPVRAWVAQPFIVRGASMEPTFRDGEYLIIDELSFQFRRPERGEVVVFRFPGDTSKFFIKRIIGLPGETIEIKNNKVFLASDSGAKELKEPYLFEALTTPDERIELAENEYLVLGDNRLFSSDSRRWGAVKKELVVGRAWLRLWPLNTIKLLPGFYKIELKHGATS